MKKFIVLAVTVMSVMNVSAQKFSDFFSTEKSTEKITFGARVALNVMGMKNNVTNDEIIKAFSYVDPLSGQTVKVPYVLEVHRRAGISVGASVEIPILKNLWINTGLYYTTTGTKLNFKQDMTKEWTGDKFLHEYSAKVTMHNLRIPIQASYRYNVNEKYQIQVNLGPYFAYGLTGKVSVKDEYDGNNIGSFDLTGNKTFSTSPDFIISEDVLSRKDYKILGEKNISSYRSNYVKPFDAGIAFGAGFTYKKHYFAGFNYDGGLVNVNGKRALPISNRSLKNHSFTLIVGYNF